jgi:hypothetical protein
MGIGIKDTNIPHCALLLLDSEKPSLHFASKKIAIPLMIVTQMKGMMMYEYLIKLLLEDKALCKRAKEAIRARGYRMI